jgi:hypothetical protein
VSGVGGGIINTKSWSGEGLLIMAKLPKTGYSACVLVDRGAIWAVWDDAGSAETDEPVAIGFSPTLERANLAARRLAATAVEGSEQVAVDHAERVLAALQQDRKWLPHLPADADSAEYCRGLSYDDILRVAVHGYRPSWGGQNEFEAAERAITAVLTGGADAAPLKFRKG